MKSKLSSFTSFTVLKESIPPGEAHLFVHINWSLAQAQQQSSLGLFWLTTSSRGARAKPKVAFQYNVQKWCDPESGGASFAKMPCLDTEPDGH